MGSNFSAVMAQLAAAGTAQNRKVYARHGAAEPMFGVSYAELGRIAKPIKTNHALAVELWDSGNHDARVLALRVADPAALDEPLGRPLAARCGQLHPGRGPRRAVRPDAATPGS